MAQKKYEYVTVVQNLDSNSLDFIMHDALEIEELEAKVSVELGIDLQEYNRQTYEADGFMQRHFILS